jgi:HAD superfamily hydrolase (TIGR01450 family)
MDFLNRTDKPYLILTNDASRSPETIAGRLRRLGMEVPVERVVSSGLLLSDYFTRHELRGSRCAVLGTEDSKNYVARAGGQLVAVADDAEIDVLVVCDDMGFPFLETINAAITIVFKALDRERPLRLVLPNPDLIFPRNHGAFGITAGSIALIIEQAIRARYPRGPGLRFDALGKPHAPIYKMALAIGGTRNMLMIGDQLGTDILGAQRFGIDSLLITQGVTHGGLSTNHSDVHPTYVMPGLM